MNPAHGGYAAYIIADRARTDVREPSGKKLMVCLEGTSGVRVWRTRRYGGDVLGIKQSTSSACRERCHSTTPLLPLAVSTGPDSNPFESLEVLREC